MLTEAQPDAACAFPVPSAPPSLPPSLTLMSVLFMATGWLVAGGAVCGASQVRVLGVLIPGWGHYLFVMVFEELFLVHVSSRTRPLLACCYCCCWLCFLLCTRCWLLCCGGLSHPRVDGHVWMLMPVLQGQGGASQQREKREWPFAEVSHFMCIAST